ncbi:MAG: DUF4097 family beta strand repeat-containing protein [Terriglobales bacterium]
MRILDFEFRVAHLAAAPLMILAAVALAAPLAAQRTWYNPDEYAYVSKPQVTSQTLAAGATPLLAVNNLNGPITVTGDGGSTVRFTATETIAAKTQDALAAAQRDIHLDVTHTGDSVTLYVDGPFRCNSDDATSRCDHWGRHWNNPGYKIQFAFELHVPAGARLDLKNISGDITSRGAGGAFQVRTINGAVDLEGLAAAGSASTINGAVRAAFAANPPGDCSFHSINGAIRLYLHPGLNANLKYRTLNGAVYSDFAVSPLAVPASSDRHGNMRVFRTGRNASGRIGQGGPTLSVNTLNGSIFLHEVK